MTTVFRNGNNRAANILFVLTWFCVSYALGDFQLVSFSRTKGDMDLPITCALGAFSMDILAVEYDTEHTCHNLGWEWEHVYDDVSTYYEKQRVVEEYNYPKPLEGAIRLPIVFDDEAYIDMYIEFTTTMFRYGGIQLINILQETFDIYDSSPEAIMISMEMRKGNSLQYKTWNDGWKTHRAMPTFPFTTGIVYKITFKALGNTYEVLVDDQQHVRYYFGIHSTEARLLKFDPVGMLLHKIEFVA